MNPDPTKERFTTLAVAHLEAVLPKCRKRKNKLRTDSEFLANSIKTEHSTSLRPRTAALRAVGQHALERRQQLAIAPSAFSITRKLGTLGVSLRRSLVIGSCCLCLTTLASAPPANGFASWYGEAHRGKLMANGKRFNPDKLTAASWFYPLGTKVRVTIEAGPRASRSVLVTITDRGPATELVRAGRIIDLAYGAFKKLGEPDAGLVPVTVHAVKPRQSGRL